MASLEQEVFDALMLVKVVLLSFIYLNKHVFHDLSKFSCGVFYIFCNFDEFCLVDKLFDCLSQRLGRDVREGKRRQFNYIGEQCLKDHFFSHFWSLYSLINDKLESSVAFS